MQDYSELEIPAFLKREMTPEIRQRLKRITVRYAQRKIKNPPKHARKTGLGAAFGVRIKEDAR